MTRGDDLTPHRADPALADLERQIAETREQLGRTVEELAAKADVPARAKAKMSEARARLRLSAHRAEEHTKERAAHAGARMKHTASRADRHGRHARDGVTTPTDPGRRTGPGSGPAPVTDAATTGAATAAGSGHGHAGSGSHLSGAVHGRGAHFPHPSGETSRRTYGAAAIGLTAATAGAAVWASRHP
jgi:hypothetical protein